MHPAESYAFHQTFYAQELKFFFISQGKKKIIKAIAYTYLQKLGQQKVYNLGFGDYDLVHDCLFDDVTANNGDAYKVFHTVLCSIPLFFDQNPQAILLVQGSDSTPEFLGNCLAVCQKNCHDGCKKFNQRINIYRNYVNKHYTDLCQDYRFYGGRKDENGKIWVEKYRPREFYEALLIEKKTVISGIVKEPEEPFIIMKKKEKKPTPSLSEAELLAMVAEKLKGKVLFPRLVENAKNFLKEAEFVSE